ncbi:uncharacterized protein BT62DRAFT_1012002 [Guyanagaster necrorhizus]|uniref:Uncharacterized protein n=1 Tax=Guyanagaster necrorhizus TaxID=856835 RepID=A0A9P7VJK1_9AGAR|nr:uncharacterized protein BT62DRAFT_1012002 [Guyanagaster necrorhizus MCA 3950]KAG7441191.1 hypothetical protein BT62DRAFT_1012002 [Guyanagaster necrorhizus MCA 3950]
MASQSRPSLLPTFTSNPIPLNITTFEAHCSSPPDHSGAEELEWFLVTYWLETTLVSVDPSLSPGPFHLGVDENAKCKFVSWTTIMLPLIRPKKLGLETILLAERFRISPVSIYALVTRVRRARSKERRSRKTTYEATSRPYRSVYVLSSTMHMRYVCALDLPSDGRESKFSSGLLNTRGPKPPRVNGRSRKYLQALQTDAANLDFGLLPFRPRTGCVLGFRRGLDDQYSFSHRVRLGLLQSAFWTNLRYPTSQRPIWIRRFAFYHLARAASAKAYQFLSLIRVRRGWEELWTDSRVVRFNGFGPLVFHRVQVLLDAPLWAIILMRIRCLAAKLLHLMHGTCQDLAKEARRISTGEQKWICVYTLFFRPPQGSQDRWQVCEEAFEGETQRLLGHRVLIRDDGLPFAE